MVQGYQVQPRDEERREDGTVKSIDRIVVLHLRASSDSGGGPEKTIYNTGRYIDRTRFLYMIAYLKKKGSDLSVIEKQAGEAGLQYLEFSGRRFVDIRQLRNIVTFVKQQGVSVLHCHDPKTDLYGVLIKPLVPGIRLVSTMHGWIERSWKSPAYNRLDFWALRFFDRVIAVSGHTERLAHERGIKKTALIHNAIDLNAWNPRSPAPSLPSPELLPSPTDAFVIGYIGRISREKGPYDFVGAAHKVLLRDNRCEFVVAGEGPEEGAVKALVDRLGMAERFHFIGRIANSDMPAVYRRINLLLSPSLTEGLPNTILEACAMGVPVVATRVGGVTEIITDGSNGLLAEAGDTDTLSDLVLRVKRDNGLSARLAENGRATVEKTFSFENRVRRVEALYEEVTGLTGKRVR